MSEGLDQDALEQDELELPMTPSAADEFFGHYAVLSPGVEIVLDGRPVSAPTMS